MNLLVTPLYEGADRERIPLYKRWLEHYTAIRDALKWDKLLFIDNASCPDTLREVIGFAPGADIFRHAQRLERVSQHVYPYVWRNLDTVKCITEFYRPERMFCMDPDFFVLTRRCAETMMTAENAWHCFWCPSHDFPALECSFIHGTGFDTLRNYKVGDYHQDTVAETAVPVKPVKHLVGDRYGEQGITEIDPSWDYIGQLNDLRVRPSSFSM